MPRGEWVTEDWPAGVERYGGVVRREPASRSRVSRLRVCICFFFQAEDGIRDLTVTGVQTCALPICAVIDGQNNSSTTGFEVNGSYIRIEGFEVRNTNRYGVDAYGGSESAAGNHDIEIGRASCRERV